MKGKHPVTEEEAIQLAGIQCQIQFGDFKENRHKVGFLQYVLILRYLINVRVPLSFALSVKCSLRHLWQMAWKPFSILF